MLRKRFAWIVVASAGIFAVFLIVLLMAVSDTAHYYYEYMPDGWRVRASISDSRGNKTYLSEDNMSAGELPEGRRGDYIQMSAKLPDMGDIPFPTVMFETRYCAFEVSVDGVVIDRYDMDKVGTRRFVGASYHFVTLPEDYAGKYLTITLYMMENRSGRAINTPVIGAHDDMEYMLVRRNFFSIGCGFFLVMFGMSFLFLTVIYINRVPELLPQLVSSILCATLGTILICNDHVAFLFMEADAATVMNYLSIFGLLPLGCVLLETLHVEHFFGAKVYRACTIGSICVMALFFLLHLLNIAHMNKTLFIYYIVVVAGMIVIVADIVKGFKEKTFSAVSAVTLTGLSTLMLLSLITMIMIVLWRLGLPMGDRAWRNLIPLGAMVFAAAQIVNYLSFISESGSRQKDYASLQNIAYADSLTGLANRARADSVFDELDRGREDYCLVSVDVNGLKDTNDRLGHVAGDRLLKDYAEALKASFGDEALCARMGGDEFLVVMKKTNADGFGVRLRRLYSDLDDMNEKDKSIFRSAAIGYAFRHECHGGDAHAVYLLADERMFENKREQHIRYRIKDRT